MKLQVVDRVLQVLEYLSRYPDRGVNQIARDLGLDKSAVSRLLAFLESRSYVIRNPVTGRFSPGFKLMELGRATEESLDLRKMALPTMHWLRDEIGESVALFVRYGFDRVCVEQVPGHNVVRRIYTVGEVSAMWPLASVGRVLMAYMPEPDQEHLSQTFAAAGHDVIRIRQELEQVRRQGYAISFGERQSHAGGISAPIFDFRGQCAGVLNIGVPTAGLTPNTIPRLASAVLMAARTISRLMGFGGAQEPSSTEGNAVSTLPSL